MKKIIFYALSLTFLVFGQTFAQSVAEQNLNEAKVVAEDIKVQVTNSRKAINLLVKQLTVLGNPNVTSFSNNMNAAYNTRDADANDVIYYVNTASAASAIQFDATVVLTTADQIIDENDFVTFNLTNQMIAAVTSNNTTLALNLVAPLRSSLTRQFNKANKIITDVNAIISQIKTYNVCINIVDNNGNPSTYNAGFYAQNEATGEYFYTGNPNDQDYGYGNCFYNLAPGTYVFGSFQDYFCGTSSATVTLSDSLLNEDNTIEVTLVVWCE